MIRLHCFAATLALLGAYPALADRVALKNGDRLSGEILRLDGKDIVLKSEFAGTVTIPWAAVTGLESDSPLYVGLKDGQTVVGAVKTAGSGFEIRTQTTGPVTAAKDSITFIRSKAEQTAYETEIARYRNPRLVDLWTGFVDLGYAKANGNADTTSLTTNANATRVTSRDKIAVYFTSIYTSSKVDKVPLETANARRGGISYSLNVTPRLFAFGSTDLEYDAFQKLDLRFSPAGGFGYHWLKTDATMLDVDGGVSLNREFFSTGLNRTSGEALFGQELTRKVNSITSIREKFTIFPNLTRTGEYRLNFDVSAITGIRKWLAWQISLSDRLLSDPVAGRKKNDMLLSTGLRLTFAK